jgi:Do/DeqQ family serine protease
MMPRPLSRLLLLSVLLCLPVAAQERIVPQSREQVRVSFAPIVRKTAPAVVNVYSRQRVRSNLSPFFSDPFFQRFFGEDSPFGRPSERVQQSLGSGVIVAADGTIVTNRHVIKDADQVTVVLADRREFEARILRADERTDLAVLKIDVRGERLPFVELGDSDALEVGDFVLAIGDPFGVGQTVTSGIVSALSRTQVGIADYRFFIQTDAAINPGNSGGALVDVDGRLVGINTAIYSRSGGSIGIGFAIPTAMVKTVLSGAGKGGRIVRPWLGASGQAVTAEIAQSIGLPRPVGVLLDKVVSGSPAAEAGIKTGDVIEAVDGREVEDAEALKFRFATLPIGETARLQIWRRGEQRDVTVALQAPPEDPPRDASPIEGNNPLNGATVANLSPALAEEIGMEATKHGVVVLSIDAGGFARRLGLEPGDIIVSINDEAITDVAALKEIIETRHRYWKLAVKRGDQMLSVTLGG